MKELLLIRIIRAIAYKHINIYMNTHIGMCMYHDTFIHVSRYIHSCIMIYYKNKKARENRHIGR